MPAELPEFVIPAEIAGHAAWHRLEDQRKYYSAKAGSYQTQYQRIKLLLIALAAAIPLLAFMPGGDAARFTVAAAGVVIAVLEGLLLLKQYGPLWVQYRAVAEGLKRERWLLLSQAGDYRDLPGDAALRLLAERVETLLAAERQSWTEEQKQALAKRPDAGG